MNSESKKEIRKIKEKENFFIGLGIIGLISLIISFFFIPLMRTETRRFGEDVVIYDYFAMTLFYVFLIVGILLIIAGISFFTLNFLKKRKLIHNESNN